MAKTFEQISRLLKKMPKSDIEKLIKESSYTHAKEVVGQILSGKNEDEVAQYFYPRNDDEKGRRKSFQDNQLKTIRTAIISWIDEKIRDNSIFGTKQNREIEQYIRRIRYLIAHNTLSFAYDDLKKVKTIAQEQQAYPYYALLYELEWEILRSMGKRSDDVISTTQFDEALTNCLTVLKNFEGYFNGKQARKEEVENAIRHALQGVGLSAYQEVIFRLLGMFFHSGHLNTPTQPNKEEQQFHKTSLIHYLRTISEKRDDLTAIYQKHYPTDRQEFHLLKDYELLWQSFLAHDYQSFDKNAQKIDTFLKRELPESLFKEPENKENKQELKQHIKAIFSLHENIYHYNALAFFLKNRIEELGLSMLIKEAKTFNEILEKAEKELKWRKVVGFQAGSSSQLASVSVHFSLFAEKQIEDLTLRYELNRIILKFCDNTTDKKQLIDDIQSVRKLIEKYAQNVEQNISITLDITLLELILTANYLPEEKRIELEEVFEAKLKESAVALHDFRSQFFYQVIKKMKRNIDKVSIEKAEKEISKSCQTDNPIHQAMLYWLRQFTA